MIQMGEGILVNTKQLLIATLSFFSALNCSQMSQAEKKIQANGWNRNVEKIPQAQVDDLEEIIDKNNVADLRKLLLAKEFDVNGTGLRYAIKFNFREFGYGPSGRGHGGWRERCSTFLPNAGITPLMFATSYAKPEIVRELLQAGADPNLGYEIDAGDTIYYPLTVGYSSNFSDSDEADALVAMTEEFLKTNISKAHFDQALNFVNTLIEAYSPDLASRLRKLFETSDYVKAQTARQMELPQRAIESHLKTTNQSQYAGVAKQLSPGISKYFQ